MNKSLRIVSPLALCLIAVATLTACQTTETAHRAAPEQRRVVNNGNQSRFVEDKAYVDRVQRQARSRGISVQWVNIPHKRVAPETGQPK